MTSISSRVYDLLQQMSTGDRFTSRDLSDQLLLTRVSPISASLHNWLDSGMYRLIGEKAKQGRGGRRLLVYEVVDPGVNIRTYEEEPRQSSRRNPTGVDRSSPQDLPIITSDLPVIISDLPVIIPFPEDAVVRPQVVRSLSEQLLDAAVLAEAIERRPLSSYTTKELEDELARRQS